MHDALNCSNHKCGIYTEHTHLLYNDIINICSVASKACFPHTPGIKGMKIVLGCNEFVKEHADNANIWHDV